MLKWSSKIIVGQFAPPLFVVKRGIEAEKPPRGVYLIVLGESQDELLEIYSAAEFKKPHLKGRDFRVVGITRGQAFANRFVRDLIGEVYGETGGFDVRGWYAGSFDGE